jgi:hypothetical protein
VGVGEQTVLLTFSEFSKQVAGELTMSEKYTSPLWNTPARIWQKFSQAGG